MAVLSGFLAADIKGSIVKEQMGVLQSGQTHNRKPALPPVPSEPKYQSTKENIP